ncbi:spore-associated protein A [Nonomuraea angiospora]|uniref:spore-associated protein A n=1 Tax=Nonomuraea angiospora TaxID=46172 RepID=UPI00378B9567
MSSKLAAVVGSALIAGGLLTGLAAPASAAGPCGSGYGLLTSYPIKSGDELRAYLDVYYSSSSGKNCAVTRATKFAGTPHSMGVGMSRSGSTWVSDSSENYAYYAGPVYVSARGSCIDLWANDGWASLQLNKVHCG